MILLIDGYKNRTGAGTSPWKLTVVFCVSPRATNDMVCYYAKGTFTVYRVRHAQSLMIDAPACALCA